LAGTLKVLIANPERRYSSNMPITGDNFLPSPFQSPMVEGTGINGLKPK
jgi:hypothetical protein